MRLGFRSLQQKLNAYALVLCVSSMGAMGVLTYTIARKQVRQGREQLMEVFARQLSQDISRELREASEDLQLWARSDSVQVAVTSLDQRSVHALLADLSGQHRRYE